MGAAEDYLKIRAEWDGRQVTRGAADTERQIDRIRGAGQRIPPVFASAGAAILGAVGVHTAMEIAKTGAELAKLSAEMSLAHETFDRMAERAGTAADVELARLRKITGGVISDLELMRKVGVAVDAGLSFDQMATTTEYLYRFSQAFGKDFNQLYSTIVSGLQRASVLLLDDANVFIDVQAAKYESLSELEKRAMIVSDAVDQMREKMSRLPEVQDNAITKANQLSVAWENLRIELGKNLQSEVSATTAFITGTVNFATKVLEDFRKTQAQGAERVRLMEEGEYVEPRFGDFMIQGAILFEDIILRTMNDVKETFDILSMSRSEIPGYFDYKPLGA